MCLRGHASKLKITTIFGEIAMKIARVTATPLYIELNIDILDVNKTNGLSVVFVEVETDEGHIGHGITAITDEDVVATVINNLAGPTIIGEDPIGQRAHLGEALLATLAARATWLCGPCHRGH